MAALGRRLGILGGCLGVIAGIVQWAFGTEIPEWTGNKLHPVQLGIITIVLSGIALLAVSYGSRTPGLSPRRMALVTVLGILAPALICFTTVGRLWYLPGPLLLAAAALILMPAVDRRARDRGAAH